MIPIHLHDAWLSLQRNRNTVAAYVAFMVCVNIAAAALDMALKPFVPQDNIPAWYPAYHLLSDLLAAAAIAAVQAILLAEIGKEIDRPLWKCPGPKEALRKFFLPWFILNLAFVTFASLHIRFLEAGQADAGMTILMALLMLQTIFIPFGACVMYGGGLRWDALGELLAPIGKMIPDSILPLGLGLLQFILMYAVAFAVPEELRGHWLSLFPTAFGIALGALLECLAFAVMWRLCMMYRDNPPENGDLFD